MTTQKNYDVIPVVEMFNLRDSYVVKGSMSIELRAFVERWWFPDQDMNMDDSWNRTEKKHG